MGHPVYLQENSKECGRNDSLTSVFEIAILLSQTSDIGSVVLVAVSRDFSMSLPLH